MNYQQKMIMFISISTKISILRYRDFPITLIVKISNKLIYTERIKHFKW